MTFYMGLVRELPSKFTISEKLYKWSWWCDATIKMY